ncbi:hypothetical protein C922_05258 [Plasmodium inui San Antonio 1]|uniref:Uncharacterized protein n=1 Tax=Plasmodium inui San Antonio 1 TaxID=1237626 RepID=W6ZYH6_9APIC|nr:hypothetical protein C922_05258 [Plasmodium inui San Antonio 1]EUD64355.1 hypothetical protein C922_05258 [Plasmodium inui San Antonio 1]
MRAQHRGVGGPAPQNPESQTDEPEIKSDMKEEDHIAKNMRREPKIWERHNEDSTLKTEP